MISLVATFAFLQATTSACSDALLVPFDEAAVANVVIVLEPETLLVGRTGQARAEARNSIGGLLAPGPVRWTSLSPEVAEVSSDGVLTALQAGAATIRAEVADAAATASVSILLPAVATLPPPGTPVATVGATTVSIAVGKVATATSYRWQGGSNAGGGDWATTTSDTVITRSLPAAGSHWVCVWSVNAAGQSATNACNSYVVPSSASPTPTPPPEPTPTPSSGDGAFYVMDFRNIADSAALDAQPGWHMWGGAGTQSIDKTMGYGGSDRSLLYTYRDRSNEADLCQNHGMMSTLDLPAGTKEIWIEVVAKFEAGFRTKVLKRDCYNNPLPGQYATVPELKFILNTTAPSSRFNLMVGTNGDQWNWGHPAEQNVVYWTGGPFNPFDGQWHTYRMHYRVGSNGVGELWADGKVIVGHDGATSIQRNLNLSAYTSIQEIVLGATMNQGPDQVQRLWWGSIKLWRAGQPPGWDVH